MIVVNKTRLLLAGLIILTGLTACNTEVKDDPRVNGFPVAYVLRPFPLHDPEQNNQPVQPDLRDPLQFYPGSDLYVRDHASAQAEPRNITSVITRGAGDVKDVEVSYDGKKLLFAMKEPEIEGLAADDQPTWNIWEYDFDTNKLRRLISQDIFAEEGHDVAPYYLPDGRIVFSSTRQYGSKESLTNEAKPQYTALVDQERSQGRKAMMLHVMNDDGTNIRQITYAPVIDMDPYVRSDGKIIFSRWDRFYNTHSSINIYSINPDGTDLQLLYGAHSHNVQTGTELQFGQLREFPDGRVLAIMRPYSGTFGGGDIVLIDTKQFADYAQPANGHGGASGTGLVSVTRHSASASESPSLGGRFQSVFPLRDGSNRSLVSWTPCLLKNGDHAVVCTEAGLADPGAVEAEPLYNLYIYDHDSQTRQTIFLAVAGQAVTDVVAAQPWAYPQVIKDTVEESDERTGILHIRSVYDYDGHFNDRGARIPITDTLNPIPEFVLKTRPDNRAARFLRLVKPFVRPYVRPNSNDFSIPRQAFGPSSNRDGLMEIIGYAPIEPDGSVKVRVPADVPFSFQIVDRNGRRISNNGNPRSLAEQRHMSWLQIRKGETLECNGCHDHNSNIPHGRRDAISPLNRGAAGDGPFPGQDQTMLARAGETMAETRIRYSCELDKCSALNPSVDIHYQDIWSRAGDKAAPFSYLYADVFSFTDDIQDPVSENCVNNWRHSCRVIINYVSHIDPLWSKARIGMDGVTDYSCARSTCHSARDAADEAQVPTEDRLANPDFDSMSQINLDNTSINFDPLDNNNRNKAYQELFSTDNRQEVITDINNIKSLADIPLLDENGAPLLDDDGNQLYERTSRVPMRSGNARGSSFFDVFVDGDPYHFDPVAGGPTLSPAEMKLISEWLDIGAQYYNDPFVVPGN